MTAARKPKGDPLLRRTPQQDRGKQRVEAILDSAEQLFAEVGYEAATTEAIAARAGASIGSLYQFFPNKKALFAALSERYLERSRAIFDAAMVPEAIHLPWDELLDAVIDGFDAFHSESPAFRAVWVHGDLSPELLAAGDAVNRAFAERIGELILHYAPDLSRAERSAMATTMVEASAAMLWTAARREGAEGKRLVAETKRMLRAYLAERVGPAGERDSAPPPRSKRR